MAPRRLGALAFAALGGLLEVAAAFHFPEDTLALHLFLKRAQGLIDIVVTYVNLHGGLNLLRLSVELFEPQKRDTAADATETPRALQGGVTANRAFFFERRRTGRPKQRAACFNRRFRLPED